MKQTAGIHHITAIVGDPQENVDFYAAVLGLRLVKKTVNFDDPGTYHLYFGDEAGSPGTIITFFPWAGAQKGKIGNGQVGVTVYAVPPGTLFFWKNRLQQLGIAFTTQERFDETSLVFEDPHGLVLELVEREEGLMNNWSYNGVTSAEAIKGFGGAVLLSARPDETAALLEKSLGMRRIGEDQGFIRFRSAGEIGNIIDVKAASAGPGQMGTGTVHHIAWRARDDEDQLEWQEFISQQGYSVTPVTDRQYFNAIYFREKGHILFEIATDPPGFAIDEAPDQLGQDLKLPPQYEEHRGKIIEMLTPVHVRELP